MPISLISVREIGPLKQMRILSEEKTLAMKPSCDGWSKMETSALPAEGKLATSAGDGRSSHPEGQDCDVIALGMVAHERGQRVAEGLMLLVQGLGGMIQQPAFEAITA